MNEDLIKSPNVTPSQESEVPPLSQQQLPEAADGKVSVREILAKDQKKIQAPTATFNKLVQDIRSKILGQMGFVKSALPESRSHIAELLQVAGYNPNQKGKWQKPAPLADGYEVVRLQKNLVNLLALKESLIRKGAEYCVEALDGTTIGRAPSSRRYAPYAYRTAVKHSVNPGFVLGLINKESTYNPSIESRGNCGLCQVRRGTFAEVASKTDRKAGIFDPYANMNAGIKYLAKQLNTFQDMNKALAAYNAGPGKVIKHGGVPPYPITRDYIKKISKWGEEFLASLAVTIPQTERSKIADRFPLVSK